MGVNQSPEENNAANQKLSRRLETLLDPAPFARWRSFGFHLQEGWREDGFAVSYNEQDVMIGRDQILELAREFRQAAIYEFSIINNENDTTTTDAVLNRRIIWCDKQKVVDGDEECSSMRALNVREIPDSELSRGVP